jgi:hypothetical protein
MGGTADDFVRQGIGVVKTGNKAHAASLFEQAIHLDQNNQAAWLWLSGCVEDKEKKRAYLERVRAIDPTTAAAQRAQEGLAHLPAGPPPSALSSLLDLPPSVAVDGGNDGGHATQSPAAHYTLSLQEQTTSLQHHNLPQKRVDFSDDIGHSSMYNLLVHRLEGVVTLKAPVYREIAESTNATTQAAIVLIAVSLVLMIPGFVAALLLIPSLTLTSMLLGLGASLLVTPLIMLALWWVTSWLLALVANTFFHGSATTAMMQRVQGYTSIFNLFLLIPILGFLVALPLALVGATIGVREAARIETKTAAFTLFIVVFIGVFLSLGGGVVWYGLSLVL